MNIRWIVSFVRVFPEVNLLSTHRSRARIPNHFQRNGDFIPHPRKGKYRNQVQRYVPSTDWKFRRLQINHVLLFNLIQQDIKKEFLNQSYFYIYMKKNQITTLSCINYFQARYKHRVFRCWMRLSIFKRFRAGRWSIELSGNGVQMLELRTD